MASRAMCEQKDTFHHVPRSIVDARSRPGIQMRGKSAQFAVEAVLGLDHVNRRIGHSLNMKWVMDKAEMRAGFPTENEDKVLRKSANCVARKIDNLR